MSLTAIPDAHGVEAAGLLVVRMNMSERAQVFERCAARQEEVCAPARLDDARKIVRAPRRAPLDGEVAGRKRKLPPGAEEGVGVLAQTGERRAHRPVRLHELELTGQVRADAREVK